MAHLAHNKSNGKKHGSPPSSAHHSNSNKGVTEKLVTLAKKLHLPPAMVAAVTLLASREVGNSASLSVAWDPSPTPSVTSYSVKYGPNSGVYTNSISVSGRLNTTLTIANLAEDATHYVVVTALTDSNLESDPSNELSVFLPSTAPVAPINFTANSTSSGSATFTWTNPTDLKYPSAKTYIYYGTRYGQDTRMVVANAGISSATLTGLRSGATYFVSARHKDVSTGREGPRTPIQTVIITGNGSFAVDPGQIISTTESVSGNLPIVRPELVYLNVNSSPSGVRGNATQITVYGGAPGQFIQLEASPTLDADSWRPVYTGVLPTEGFTGEKKIYIDYTYDQPMRFYRVKSE